MSNGHKHTDEELVILFKENDVVAFREIYVRYWYELYLISNKRLRCKEASEEIIQNFFTLFWINRKKINIRGALKAYLHTSIRYSVIDYLAREATRNNYLELLSFSYKDTVNSTGKEDWNGALFLFEMLGKGEAKIGEGINIASATGDQDWKLYDRAYIVPPGTLNIKLLFALGYVSGTMFVDDVSLKVISQAEYEKYL